MSLDPTHPSILLRSHSSPDISELANTGTPPPSRPGSTAPSRTSSISFAPLPSIDDAKRSKLKRRPLGVAGRSLILRQQRLQRHPYDADDYDNCYPRSHHARHAVYNTNTDDDDDDALRELGRLMKDAGKRLMRSFSFNRTEVKPPTDICSDLSDRPSTPPSPLILCSPAVDEKHRDLKSSGQVHPTQSETFVVVEYSDQDHFPSNDDRNDSGYHEDAFRESDSITSGQDKLRQTPHNSPILHPANSL